MDRYVGLDAHAKTCTLAVLSRSGKRVDSKVVETNGRALVDAVKGIAALVKFLVSDLRFSRGGLALETGLEKGVELIECTLDGGGGAAPAAGLERAEDEAELELQGVLGLEVAARVAA